MSDDEPRLIHKRLGYTSRVAEALPGEPEAVSAEEQARQTEQAHRRDRLHLRREWETVHQAIDPPLRRFAEVTAKADPNLRREVAYTRSPKDGTRIDIIRVPITLLG